MIHMMLHDKSATNGEYIRYRNFYPQLINVMVAGHEVRGMTETGFRVLRCVRGWAWGGSSPNRYRGPPRGAGAPGNGREQGGGGSRAAGPPGASAGCAALHQTASLPRAISNIGFAHPRLLHRPHQTTSATLSWTLYFLAKNPTCMEKALAEIRVSPPAGYSRLLNHQVACSPAGSAKQLVHGLASG
jgi:hypothetical protein